MGIMNKSTPVQSGKVYGTLNQPEVFVEYSGVTTDTAETIVNNVTKKISVNATVYIVEVALGGSEINVDDFNRIAQSTATKIAVKGITTAGKVVNVICSASEDRAATDSYYKYYGPEDASGYAYVVKVAKEPTVGALTYHCTVEQEFIALMKENFTTGVTVGALPAGSPVSAGTKVADLLQTILQGQQPTSDYIFKRYESTTKPTTISDDWYSVTMPSTAKTGGYIFNESTAKLNRGFLSFAFTAEIGELKHIYQNGLAFDILDSFTKSEVIYNETAYFMYVSNDDATFDNETYYKIV